MFSITATQASVLSIPATYATAFGFIFSYGKLLVAMAESRLLPRPLRVRHYKTHAPYWSLILGSVVGYGLCLLIYYQPSIGAKLFNVCILSAFVAYTAQCVGYIMLSTKYKNLPREFRSPLGIYGAVYSMFVWLLASVSIVGFQKDDGFAISVFVGMCIFFSIFYHVYSKNRQTFSEEERKILFVAHVINCKYHLYTDVDAALRVCLC